MCKFHLCVEVNQKMPGNHTCQNTTMIRQWQRRETPIKLLDSQHFVQNLTGVARHELRLPCQQMQRPGFAAAYRLAAVHRVCSSDGVNAEIDHFKPTALRIHSFYMPSVWILQSYSVPYSAPDTSGRSSKVNAAWLLCSSLIIQPCAST